MPSSELMVYERMAIEVILKTKMVPDEQQKAIPVKELEVRIAYLGDHDFEVVKKRLDTAIKEAVVQTNTMPTSFHKGGIPSHDGSDMDSQSFAVFDDDDEGVRR